MQQLHFRIILFSFLLYFLCSGITLRDLVLIYSYHIIQDDALVDVQSNNIFEGAISGMMMPFNEFHDDYSYYIPHRRQKDFFDELENNYDGIGITYSSDPNNKELPVIMYPILNSPAYEAGIRSGDKIIRVNGKNTESLSAKEIAKLFRNNQEKSVRLTIQKFQSKETSELTLERKPLFRDTVEGDGIDASGNRTFVLQTKPEIAYIRITSFSSSTSEELHTALQKIGKPEIKGLILDLRGNPGGYVVSAVEAANLFIKPSSEYNTVVSTRSRSGEVKSSYPVDSGEDKFEKKMVVLVDKDSASASEILAAALQDYKRATVIGTRSYGKGTVQEIVELPFNSGIVKLTHCGYWRPSGKNINRFWDSKDTDEWGVSPDAGYEIKIPEKQRAAQTLLRNVRSNAAGKNKEEYLMQYIKQLPEEVKQFIKEQKEDENEEYLDEDENEDEDDEEPDNQFDSQPLVLQGNAPYYDPQLEKAVEILSNY
jgi:carboxyl-terminal processing protease